MSHLSLLSAIPLSIYGLLGVARKMLDIFSHPLEGCYLVGRPKLLLGLGAPDDQTPSLWLKLPTLHSIVMGNLRNLLLVLVNLPFALVGGVLAALLTGWNFSLGSPVGFVTLFGSGCGTPSCCFALRAFWCTWTARPGTWRLRFAVLQSDWRRS